MKRNDMETKKLGKKAIKELTSKHPELFTSGNFSFSDKGHLQSPAIFNKEVHLSMLGKLSRWYDTQFNTETTNNTPEVKTEAKTVTAVPKKRHRRTKQELIEAGYIKGDNPQVKKPQVNVPQQQEEVKPIPQQQVKPSNDIIIPSGAVITFTATWTKA